MAPYDLVDHAGELKKFQYGFVISPKQWASFKTSARLTWKSVRFTEANRRSVPAQRGVYAFVIGRPESGLPPHAFPMYIGETGHANARTLYQRYSDYLAEQKSSSTKRPKVKLLLKQWKDSLYFHFAPVPDRRFSLKKLEQSLNDALLPPCSTRDFSATLRPAVAVL